MTDPQQFTAVARGPELDAILAALRTHSVLVDAGARPAGGGYPADDASQQFVPYAVVYPGPTVEIDGPVSDPNADTINEYQVTSVGETLAQAVWQADQVRNVMLRGLVIAGRGGVLVQWDHGREATRDDDVTPPAFFAIDIYTVSSSPA